MVGLIVILLPLTLSLNDPPLVSGESAPSQPCPNDLSELRPQMEAALTSVNSPSFKKAMLKSLSESNS